MDKIVENIKNFLIGENEKNDDKMEIDKPKEIINKDINKVINFCSRCGGAHFDLSCIYTKN